MPLEIQQYIERLNRLGQNIHFARHSEMDLSGEVRAEVMILAQKVWDSGYDVVYSDSKGWYAVERIYERPTRPNEIIFGQRQLLKK